MQKRLERWSWGKSFENIEGLSCCGIEHRVISKELRTDTEQVEANSVTMRACECGGIGAP